MYGNYFKFEELLKTETGLPNSVSSCTHLGNLANLWHALNRIRTFFGKAVYVNSAYRTPAVNKSVGGTENSYHLQGLAADIRPQFPKHLKQLWDAVEQYDASYGLSEKILYPTFIHIAI